MGVLSEVVIMRLSDKETFLGHCWAHEDGSFEAFWYEAQNRVTLFFECDGTQKGAWKKYKLRLRG